MGIAKYIQVKRALIVDDNDLIRQSLKKVFDHYPVEVSLAASGADALTEIHSNFFDLCLLEVCLPDISGIEVMRRIKSGSPSTRIAIVTAPPISDNSAGFVHNEANYLIEKPFNLSEIKTLADGLLDGYPRA